MDNTEEKPSPLFDKLNMLSLQTTALAIDANDDALAVVSELLAGIRDCIKYQKADEVAVHMMYLSETLLRIAYLTEEGATIGAIESAPAWAEEGFAERIQKIRAQSKVQAFLSVNTSTIEA